MITTPVENVVVTETIHYCDYSWTDQSHIACMRPWVHPTYTDKKLIAAGYQRAGMYVYTTDKNKVTCEKCKKNIKN